MKYSKILAVVISLSIFLLNFERTVETEVTAIEKVSSDSYLSEFFELSVDEIKEKIGDKTIDRHLYQFDNILTINDLLDK